MGEKLEATACKLAIRKSFYFILWIRRGVDFIFSTQSTVFRFRMQMEMGMRVLNELAAPAARAVGRTEWALFVIPFRGCFSLFTLYSMCVLCAGAKAWGGKGVWIFHFSRSYLTFILGTYLISLRSLLHRRFWFIFRPFLARLCVCVCVFILAPTPTHTPAYICMCMCTLYMSELMQSLYCL